MYVLGGQTRRGNHSSVEYANNHLCGPGPPKEFYIFELKIMKSVEIKTELK